MGVKKNESAGGETRRGAVVEARAARHRRWWREVLALIASKGPPRRSEQAQMGRRRLEREARVGVVAVVRLLRLQGKSWGAIETRVRIRAETLRSWLRQWHHDRLEVSARGRRLCGSARETRNLVFALLGLMGPTLSLQVLREVFPAMARRELESLLGRYRRVWRKRGVTLHVVRWRNDGAVWAMDFTEAPSPIDGQYPYALAVRDLGSGKQLMSLPTVDQSGETVRNALRSLFVEHGVPLVLKSDNGSGFIDDETRALLAAHAVLPLLSPPGTPRFNGACEAGIGGLKTRAHHEAARHDRPGHWTCDDVEVARLMANATPRPHGVDHETPDERWACRSRPEEAARLALIELAKTCTTEERDRLSADVGGVLQRCHEAAAARIGLCRALVQLGYVQLRRRRFTLQIESKRRSINS